MSGATKGPMPLVFFGHGNPMNALERNSFSEGWARIGAAVPKPATILSISAHWYTRKTGVTVLPAPQTIHDFGNFPDELFRVQYPAPGEPELAARIREMLKPLEIVADEEWGLDHGTWSVLVHAFPKADIPVIQISIDATKPNRFHYDLGTALAPLRDEGVLIVGSGNIVHNLGLVRWRGDGPAYDWADRFDMQVRDLILTGNHVPLIDYPSLGEDAMLSVPTPEHYLPLLYILGAQRPGDRISFPVEGMAMGSLSMRSVAIGM